MSKPEYGIVVTHIAMGEATEDEITLSINRYGSAIASISNLLHYASEQGIANVPVDLIGHILWTCASGKDDAFEKALKRATTAAKEGDMAVFHEVDGKPNLPDNVVKFPGNDTKH